MLHGADVLFLYFLPACLAVDGLEKSSSLASCDVVVDNAAGTQNAPATRQQRGKLSSLGKLFKPWKWRKKKTSDKFQDLSKGGSVLLASSFEPTVPPINSISIACMTNKTTTFSHLRGHFVSEVTLNLIDS